MILYKQKPDIPVILAMMLIISGGISDFTLVASRIFNEKNCTQTDSSTLTTQRQAGAFFSRQD